MRSIRRGLFLTQRREAREGGRTRIAISAAALVVLVASQSMNGADSPSAAAKQAAGKAAAKITVSKQTTYVTGPLRPDGYVDFVAAINERCSRGVTVENNAAVPLWRAIGPGRFDRPDAPAQFFKRLGIAELPKEGPYLVDLDHWKGWKNPSADDEANEQLRGEIQEQFETAQRRPWSKAEFPVLAEWLRANQKPLELIIEGTRRPKYLRRLWPTTAGPCLFSIACRQDGYLMRRDSSLPVPCSASTPGKSRRRGRTCWPATGWDGWWRGGHSSSHGWSRPTSRIGLVGRMPRWPNMASLPPSNRGVFRPICGDCRQCPPWWKPMGRANNFTNSTSSAPWRGRQGNVPAWFGLMHEQPWRDAVDQLIVDARVDWDDVLRECNAELDQTIEAYRKPSYAQRKMVLKGRVNYWAAKGQGMAEPAAWPRRSHRVRRARQSPTI